MKPRANDVQASATRRGQERPELTQQKLFESHHVNDLLQRQTELDLEDLRLVFDGSTQLVVHAAVEDVVDELLFVVAARRVCTLHYTLNNCTKNLSLYSVGG